MTDDAVATDTEAEADEDEAVDEAVEEVPEADPGVPITINGREVSAKPGELLIDAAERHGSYIPVSYTHLTLPTICSV